MGSQWPNHVAISVKMIKACFVDLLTNMAATGAQREREADMGVRFLGGHGIKTRELDELNV